MKNLILISCFFILLCTYASAQNLAADTIVSGSTQNNYPGGQDAYNKYISGNAHYPAPAFNNNVQGRAYVEFIIGKDSTLINVKTYRVIGSGMDEEALKLIKQSGKWIPKAINGEYVRTVCIVPINFMLVTGDDNNLKSAINGNATDTSFLSAAIALESSGISLSESENYVNKPIRFIGKIYGTKALADTVLVLTCGDINYPSKYVNVALMGKDAQTANSKMKLTGYLIKGTGQVNEVNGIPVVIINDRKNYTLIKEPKQSH